MQEPFVARLRAEMNAHAQAFGGRYVDYPRTSPIFGGALTTVHPLGGCPMADDPGRGVVDEFGRVHGYPGLLVLDGSIVPTALGVNPSKTIAALAERGADRLAAELA